MQRLNIQLGNTKTTRPKRRVVWTLLGLGLMTYASIFLATNWIFSFALANTVPEGTVATLVINPNRQNQAVVQKALVDWPLITNTNWTWSDIQHLKAREIAIYWLQDGTRAMGIRTNQGLPRKNWDENGIKIQEVGKGRYILSDQTCALTQENIDFSVHWPKLAFWDKTKHLGRIFFYGEEQESGLVLGSDERIEIRLKKRDLTRLPFDKTNETVIGALSIPVWTKLNTSWISQNTINNLQPLSKIDLNATINKLANSPGNILWASKDGQLTFLLETEEETIPWVITEEIIRLAAALNLPNIRTFSLPDSSAVQEMVIDPEAIMFEEVLVGVQRVKKATIGPNEYFLAAKNGRKVILSNNQELLEFYWHPETGTKPVPCGLRNAYIDLKAMQSFVAAPLNTYSNHPLVQIADKFSFVGISAGFTSTKLILCY